MLRFSTGLRNRVGSKLPWRDALGDGRLMIYSGSQPALADNAPAGVLLATFTVGAAAFTAETKPTATIQVTSGGSGSIDSVTVGGFTLIDSPVAWNNDVNTTASDLRDAINAYNNGIGVTAELSVGTVTLSMPKGMGEKGNGVALATTTTTVVLAADATFSGGVDAANGLNFSEAVNGVLSKLAGEWKADPVASGTAGWFRYVCDGDDSQGASVEFARIDGTIATSGGDINLGSTYIEVGTPQTINSFSFTVPAYPGS